MEISLKAVSKKFDRSYLFKDINKQIAAGEQLIILGPNGSGKSSFIKLVNGALSPSEGEINYSVNGNGIAKQDLHKYCNIAAPYMDIPSTYTAEDLLNFHNNFKKTVSQFTINKIRERLAYSSKFEIHELSSGMLARLKLVLALCFHSKLVLLDEPCANLDAQGVKWYMELLDDCLLNRTLLLASNNKLEYDFLKNPTKMNIQDYR